MSKTVFLDQQFRCHAEYSDGLVPFETSYFDDREETIEKYQLIPHGETWERWDGITFHGEMICPWSDHNTLPDFLRVKELEAALAEIQEALNG